MTAPPPPSWRSCRKLGPRLRCFMPTAARKRSPRRAELEPIHVDELLGAAGMNGCLGVLDPPEPVPHLRVVLRQVRWDESAQAVERELRRREELLARFAEGAWRVNAAARKLNRRVQALLKRARRSRRGSVGREWSGKTG
jgi:hypothetical protein